MNIENQVITQPKHAHEEYMKRCPACGHDQVSFWLEGPDRFHGGSQLYRLLRCSRCSMVWLDNPPKPDEMSLHYGPDYHRAISSAGENSPGRWRDRRRTLLQHKCGGSLLDLGCSSGAFLEYMKGPSWQLYGIEMSTDTAKRAESRAGAYVFVGDIMDAPFQSRSFDVVTCFDVLEHVYEPHKVLARVYEWLKPGGIFYVLVPNIDSGEARTFRTYWYGLELPRHLSHFSPVSLRGVAQSVGLREIHVQACPNPSVETSMRYICDEILRKIGLPRSPLATARPISFLWRVMRKVLRLSALPLGYRLICLKGEGESIHAIFEKPAD